MLSRDRTFPGRTIPIPGAKNVAMPALAAVVALRMRATLVDMPRIADVCTLVESFTPLGVKFAWEGSGLCVDAREVEWPSHLSGFTKACRGSVYVVSAIAALFGRCPPTQIRGDPIRGRQLSAHLRVLLGFGFEAHLDGGTLSVKAPTSNPARTIQVGDRGISATCCALLLAAAVGAGTLLEDCSCEHEVLDFAGVLRALGQAVEVSGRSISVAPGVGSARSRTMEPVTVRLPSDLTVAGTVAVAAALREEEVAISLHGPAMRSEILARNLAQCGVAMRRKLKSCQPDTWTIRQLSRGGFAVTLGWPPSLPADLQPLLSVLALFRDTPSFLTDSAYEDRTDHLFQLRKMGGSSNGKVETSPYLRAGRLHHHS